MNLQPIRLAGVEDRRPLVIAGPCSAETEEQVMNAATQLANRGVKIFRAGIWKPRTKPGGFEGVGEPVTTEVATAKHVEEALNAGVDILWVGARTSANPFAMQELADSLQGVDIPVFVKNPVNPDLDLWVGGLERINGAGIKRIGVIHRGFSSYDKRLYRNVPMWHIPIELRRRIPNIPIFCDPSHIGGARELIAPLCQQAMDLGFDVLDFILDKLVIRNISQTTESLEALRRKIDEIDNALIEQLAKRMRVSREIGKYKREHNMTVVQTGRYNEILDKRGAQGVLCGMSSDFMKCIFEAIHEESVRQQIDILNK